MNFVLVHGFNVKDGGAESVGLFAAPLVLAGHLVFEMPYGRAWWPLGVDLLMVRAWNRKRAATLRRMCEGGAVVVAHSNGAAIALEAARQGANIERMVLINPALDTDAELPAQVCRVDVFHTPWDWPTRISTYLLLHPWGRMGAVGHKGRDSRWINWNMGTGKVRRSGEDHGFTLPGWCPECFPVRGHSAVFRRGLKSWHFWWPFLFHAALGTTGYWDWIHTGAPEAT